MKAKELAEILLTKPESDVCIKREYVINPHGDTDYCTKDIELISIKDISKAGSFSEIYHITIKNPDYDDLVLVDGDFIFKTGKITMQFSSVVLYEAQFIPASDLK